VSGKLLSCGCLVGIYETYQGGTVRTIDVRGSGCSNPAHALHAEIPAIEAPEPRGSVPLEAKSSIR
jgi:hypothetical protein